MSTHTWDAEGELVADDDYTYVYDASGNRIVRKSAGATTVYLPGGQEINIDGNAVSATRYYSFGGMTVAMRESNGLGGVTSLVSDRDGSVLAAIPNTEWTANSVARVYSDPFGNIRGNTDADVPGDHRFLGATRDEASGLTLLGARYYDPVVGRFISVDPILNLNVPAHLHAYAYGFNNPVTFSDASGLEPRDKHGNYDGNPYGGGSGASKGSGGGPAAPPSTSWAALNACQDVMCVASWKFQFELQVYGGILEGVGGLLWMTCGPCQGFSSFSNAIMPFTDPEAYKAQQQAQSEQFFEFWSDPWNNFWQPFGEDWANNPGHALGGTIFTAATLVVPGGGVIKAGSAAGKLGTFADDALGAVTCVANSFAPDTKVLMADGSTKPIEQVELGEEVWAADPETGEAGARPVTALIEGTGLKDLVTVSTSEGSVVATAGHPFWSASDSAWVEAGDLVVGDALLEAGGATTVVTAVSEESRTATVHNLTVDDIHTYFVVMGDALTLVHNCGASFVASADGVVVPLSREVLEDSLQSAGLATFPTKSPGLGYVYPDGSTVRIMEPSGANGLRASFENANGGPISPFTGLPVQPPPGLVGSTKEYVRERTHVSLQP